MRVGAMRDGAGDECAECIARPAIFIELAELSTGHRQLTLCRTCAEELTRRIKVRLRAIERDHQRRITRGG